MHGQEIAQIRRVVCGSRVEEDVKRGILEQIRHQRQHRLRMVALGHREVQVAHRLAPPTRLFAGTVPGWDGDRLRGEAPRQRRQAGPEREAAENALAAVRQPRQQRLEAVARHTLHQSVAIVKNNGADGIDLHRAVVHRVQTVDGYEEKVGKLGVVPIRGQGGRALSRSLTQPRQGACEFRGLPMSGAQNQAGR